jgi:hypothetical protein
VHLLDRPALAQVHVHAARQAGVERAHRAHDVDPSPRTASWKPQPIASSGTSKFVNTRVLPVRSSFIAFSTKCRAMPAA